MPFEIPEEVYADYHKNSILIRYFTLEGESYLPIFALILAPKKKEFTLHFKDETSRPDLVNSATANLLYLWRKTKMEAKSL